MSCAFPEDAWNGDAQFTVAVDGVQAGGTDTAHALHSEGADESLFLSGHWGAGPHTVSVTFLNDAHGGTPATDRNLYADQVIYDGVPVPGTPLTPLSNGTQTVSTASSGTWQSGISLVELGLSEDAYDGDAKFIVAVDGKTIDTPETVTTLHSSGASQDFWCAFKAGSGTHDLAITFLNDAYGGTPTTDCNLYVNSITTPAGTLTPNFEIAGNLTQHFKIST